MSFDPELDRLYTSSKFSPRGVECVAIFVDRIVQYSEKFRKEHGGKVETIQYGDGPKQLMDIVRPENLQKDTEIVLFIHGGFWVETSRDMYLYVAEPIIQKGKIAVIVGYDQAPQVSLTRIMEEIRDAYIFLCKKFPDCKSLTAYGHSAGGHLASMLIATDWEKYKSASSGESPDRLIPIRKCVPVSGIPDVRPVVHIGYNEQLKLTREETQALSPVLLIPTAAETCRRFGTKVISVVAQHDTPAFRRHSKEYTECLVKASVDAKLIEIPELDHFNIIEKVTEQDFQLNEIILSDGE